MLTPPPPPSAAPFPIPAPTFFDGLLTTSDISSAACLQPLAHSVTSVRPWRFLCYFWAEFGLKFMGGDAENQRADLRKPFFHTGSWHRMNSGVKDSVISGGGSVVGSRQSRIFGFVSNIKDSVISVVFCVLVVTLGPIQFKFTDGRKPSHSSYKWHVAVDVESLVWDPHTEYNFIDSLENGMIQYVDLRAATSSSGTDLKPSFTVYAHEKAASSISSPGQWFR